MVAVRKERAGSDSFGHDWPDDGSVVDMPLDEAEALVAIPDGGFSIVDEPAPPDPGGDAGQEVDESPPPTKRGRKPKAAESVEE